MLVVVVGSALLLGRVTATVQKPVAEVTEAEACAVGSTDRGQVLAGLRGHHPELADTDEIVLVGFEVDP